MVSYERSTTTCPLTGVIVFLVERWSALNQSSLVMVAPAPGRSGSGDAVPVAPSPTSGGSTVGLLLGDGTDGAGAGENVAGSCDALPLVGVAEEELPADSEDALGESVESVEPPPARSRVIEQAPSPVLRASAHARAATRRREERVRTAPRTAPSAEVDDADDAPVAESVGNAVGNSIGNSDEISEAGVMGLSLKVRAGQKTGIMISTRRLSWRPPGLSDPSGLVLGAAGWVSP